MVIKGSEKSDSKSDSDISKGKLDLALIFIRLVITLFALFISFSFIIMAINETKKAKNAKENLQQFLAREFPKRYCVNCIRQPATHKSESFQVKVTKTTISKYYYNKEVLGTHWAASWLCDRCEDYDFTDLKEWEYDSESEEFLEEFSSRSPGMEDVLRTRIVRYAVSPARRAEHEYEKNRTDPLWIWVFTVIVVGGCMRICWWANVVLPQTPAPKN